jgi:hypothetical protein
VHLVQANGCIQVGRLGFTPTALTSLCGLMAAALPYIERHPLLAINALGLGVVGLKGLS